MSNLNRKSRITQPNLKEMHLKEIFERKQENKKIYKKVLENRIRESIKVNQERQNGYMQALSILKRKKGKSGKQTCKLQ